MKRIIMIMLVLVLLVSSTSCNSNANILSIEKAFNYLGQPVTDFPFYGLESGEGYSVSLNNKEDPEILGDDFYDLSINFENNADASGFLGIKDYNVSYITVYFDYCDVDSSDDTETVITGVYFHYDLAGKEYFNKILLKYFESDDFTRTESKDWDYKYTYKYNEDKYVCFGEKYGNYWIHFQHADGII